MPETKPKRVPAPADPRLTQLIRLKRLEKPSPEFWLRFEQEFRTRQLSSFVRVQPWHARLQRSLVLAARKAAPPATALGAIGLAILAISQASYFAQEEPDAAASVANTPAAELPEEAAYFVVQSEPGANEQAGSDWAEAQPASPLATYQVNPLRKAPQNGKAYRLLTSPVTFSRNAPADGSASSIGAQVIRTRQAP